MSKRLHNLLNSRISLPGLSPNSWLSKSMSGWLGTLLTMVGFTGLGPLIVYLVVIGGFEGLGVMGARIRNNGPLIPPDQLSDYAPIFVIAAVVGAVVGIYVRVVVKSETFDNKKE